MCVSIKFISLSSEEGLTSSLVPLEFSLEVVFYGNFNTDFIPLLVPEHTEFGASIILL